MLCFLWFGLVCFEFSGIKNKRPRGNENGNEKKKKKKSEIIIIKVQNAKFGYQMKARQKVKAVNLEYGQENPGKIDTKSTKLPHVSNVQMQLWRSTFGRRLLFSSLGPDRQVIEKFPNGHFTCRSDDRSNRSCQPVAFVAALGQNGNEIRAARIVLQANYGFDRVACRADCPKSRLIFWGPK